MAPSNPKKTDPNKKSRAKKSKPWIIAGVILAIVIAIIGVGVFYLFHNYAQDAAQPLDTALVAGGAIRICGSGDPGKGPDNYSPYYSIAYEFNGTTNSAVKLISKVAKDNGYSLSYQASPYPYLSWYKDQTGKPSTYPGFSNGNVTVSFSVDGSGEKKLNCNLQPLQSDAAHTAISLEVDLPSSK